MNEKKNKLLPEVITESNESGVDLESGHQFAYHLKLIDNITAYKAVGSDTEAVLNIVVTKKDEYFPDPSNWLTYRFSHIDGLKKKSDGSLEISSDKERQFLQKLNQMNSSIIERYNREVFGKEMGGNISEGLENTDMKYKIERNYSNKDSVIRVDIYQDGTNNFKPVNKVKVNLVLNKRNQVNLETDGLKLIPVLPVQNRLSIWWIVLIAASLVSALLLIFFRKKVIAWVMRKKRSESSRDQLEVF